MGDLEYFLWKKDKKSKKVGLNFPNPALFKSLENLNKLGIDDLLLRKYA